MASPKNQFQVKFDKRYLLAVAVIAVGLYVLLPQFANFKSSWHLLSHPDLKYAMIAGLCVIGTYFAGAGIYWFLAFKRLNYLLTVIVQLAAMFVNRLLPTGLGALGVNYLYLRNQKHTSAQALSVVTINNLLGLIGHGIIVLVAFMFNNHPHLAHARNPQDTEGLIIKVLVAVAVIVLICAIIYGRKKILKGLRDIATQLASYRQRPGALLGGLFMSMLLTMFNMLALMFCLMALGVHLPIVVIIIVFTFGVGAGAAVPTPGGLGGFEAGLVAGFVAYGVGSSQALAVALLFRLVSYWIPLIIGASGFAYAQHKKLFVQ